MLDKTDSINGVHGILYTDFRGTRSVVAAENAYHLLKRLVDLAIVFASLPLILPLCLVIMIMIRFDSSGPAIFVHPRVGARKKKVDGKIGWDICTFPTFKFRTMTHNADQSLHQEHVKAFVNGQLDQIQNDGPKSKLTEDPRVTRIGKLLRKTSLDELPQLINIFRGEMSLVGPRPVPEYEVALYDQCHYERLNALPGLTGLWQIEGRGEVTFEEMIEMDIRYIRNKSLWLDLKILLLTVPSVLQGKGAV